MRTILFILLVSVSVSAQEMRLSKGVVMDSLPVNDTIKETYSLFLPQSFENNGSPKPVIFLFDSEGRGRTAAQLFKSAAEEQDYIIASSNNISPNNTLEENVNVAARLMNAVTTNIPVDFNRISVAGFGEGAQVATALPAVYKNIHGVIAIGDNQLILDYLDKNNKLVFVGVAGDEDIAAYGIRATAAQLESMGFPVAVYIFDGGHEWPNPAIISAAMSSLTLQAMKSRKIPRDQQLIRTMYQDDLGRVNKLISTGDAFKAYNLMDVLLSKYDGLISLSELQSKQRQLSRTRNYSEERKTAGEIQNKESRLIDDFIYYLNEDVATANFENLGWWNYQKLELEKLAGGENELEADMGKRLLNLLDKISEMKRAEIAATERSSLESELLANMIQTIFDQNDFQAYKKVISLSAQDDDYSTALFYLEEMLKNGYEELEPLYDIEGTLALKLTPEFNWLVKKYLGTSKFYDEQ